MYLHRGMSDQELNEWVDLDRRVAVVPSRVNFTTNVEEAARIGRGLLKEGILVVLTLEYEEGKFHRLIDEGELSGAWYETSTKVDLDFIPNDVLSPADAIREYGSN
jgi:hypothetical protein